MNVVMEVKEIKVLGNPKNSIFYTVSNPRIDGNFVKWDDFRMYTPEGDLTDENGFKYFNVPADEYEIIQDPVLWNGVNIASTVNHKEPYSIEIMEGEQREERIDKEGDVFIMIPVPPSSSAEDVKVIVKNVVRVEKP